MPPTPRLPLTGWPPPLSEELLCPPPLAFPSQDGPPPLSEELLCPPPLTSPSQDGSPPLSEELLIVAAGQHVERWKSPRGAYPEVCRGGRGARAYPEGDACVCVWGGGGGTM